MGKSWETWEEGENMIKINLMKIFNKIYIINKNKNCYKVSINLNPIHFYVF